MAARGSGALACQDRRPFLHSGPVSTAGARSRRAEEDRCFPRRHAHQGHRAQGAPPRAGRRAGRGPTVVEERCRLEHPALVRHSRGAPRDRRTAAARRAPHLPGRSLAPRPVDASAPRHARLPTAPPERRRRTVGCQGPARAEPGRHDHHTGRGAGPRPAWPGSSLVADGRSRPGARSRAQTCCTVPAGGDLGGAVRVRTAQAATYPARGGPILAASPQRIRRPSPGSVPMRNPGRRPRCGGGWSHDSSRSGPRSCSRTADGGWISWWDGAGSSNATAASTTTTRSATPRIARDLYLTSRGYRVTRLSWEQVFVRWEETREMLLAILRRGEHLEPPRR